MSAKRNLESYKAMLTEGEHPIISCHGGAYVNGSNHKYEFHLVVLNIPLYVVSKDDPTNPELIRNFVAERLWIECKDDDVIANLRGHAQDCNVKEKYKTSLLLWIQYAGSVRGLRACKEQGLPGNLFLDWFAYNLARVHDRDTRTMVYRNVVILTDIPYLAGQKVRVNDSFGCMLMQRNTGIVRFLDENDYTVSIGIIPNWNLTIDPFERKTTRTLTVGVAAAFVDEARAPLIIDSTRMMMLKEVVAADIMSRTEDSVFNVRTVFLDLDAFLNTNFASECELCIQKRVGDCECEERNEYFKAFSHIQKLYVFVFTSSTDLNGGLCQSAIALAGCLNPEDIHMVAYESCGTPQELLGGDFEETLARYAPSSHSIPVLHWTSCTDHIALDDGSPLLSLQIQRPQLESPK